MNCKPGDLAVRVAAFGDSLMEVGALVRCVRLNRGVVRLVGVQDGPGHEVNNTWQVEWRGKTHSPCGRILAIPDEHLRPIRDPGDDAQDETLQWLPVPSTEKEAA